MDMYYILVASLKHLALDLELMDNLPEPVIDRLSDIKNANRLWIEFFISKSSR